jgi:aconitate hydratase
MEKRNPDSFNTKQKFKAGGKKYAYYSLRKLSDAGVGDISRLPYSLRILLENLIRHEDGVTVTKEDIVALAGWDPVAEPTREIEFMPARVLLQDFTGVPAVVDLASIRSALTRLGADPGKVNPRIPVDLVIDHSIQVDRYGSETAFLMNEELEFNRNKERYHLLKWGQQAFENFTVVPPNTGICHQVNLEFLGRVAVVAESDDGPVVYPDTLVGTDSHTPMINGIGVLGWGVGGIEAEAVLLGQPYGMLIPQVVGVRLTGRLAPYATATDLVLTITERLRGLGVVGKFVEYFGSGVPSLSVADRATIGNMTPEYGATVGIFPVDEKTAEYLRLTGREETAELVEAYYREQDLWYDPEASDPVYSQVVEIDLGSIEPSLAGPSRPQDRVALSGAGTSFFELLENIGKMAQIKMVREHLEEWMNEGGCPPSGETELAPVRSPKDICVPISRHDGTSYGLCHGYVVIAAITSCTNTSNPSVMIGAGLLARNALKRGLQVKPWVKTSFAPGSVAVTDYLAESGLMPYLEGLRFHLVGYGCTTCIGNSGPLPDDIKNAIAENDLVVASVLSGNRNFEGRIHNQVRANYLASPPLVVAYALAGKISLDLTKDPLALDTNGDPVYLADIWPDHEEVQEFVQKYVTPAKFKKTYSDVFQGSERWSTLEVTTSGDFSWDEASTYIKEPSYFDGITTEIAAQSDIVGARVLVLLGDSVTTDHISPAGAIPEESPAGQYLLSKGVSVEEFNSYGSRRGNHEVMIRGTFANVRVKNQLVPGVEGGVTLHIPRGDRMWIYDAAMKYRDEKMPLIVIAGKEYGTGSSRDWAAKGTKLLGVDAVIAESFERIHRSNLIGMGVLPLQFEKGESWKSLGLTGREVYGITGVSRIGPGSKLQVKAVSDDGSEKEFSVLARIDTPNEVTYFKNGGILPFVLRQFLMDRG